MFRVEASKLHSIGRRHSYIPKQVLTSRFLSARNSKMSLSNKVIILSGATSAGKSAVSMELATRLNAEIVIADSVQVYRKLDIGSNKPTIEEQRIVPHHLIDCCDANEPISAQDFCQRASDAIKSILSRGKVPIVVGGSTMWIQWLVSGVPDAPKGSEESKAQVQALLGDFERDNKWEEAIAILASYAPEHVSKVKQNDWYRLKRALQIAIDLSGTDKSLDSLQGDRTPVLEGYDLRCFFLMEDRTNLYRIIDERCVQMLEKGLLEEVGELLYNFHLTAATTLARAIGYRQTIEYLCRREIGPHNFDEFSFFLKEFGTATRNYARVQNNWYRKEDSFLLLKIRRPPFGQEEGDHKLLPFQKVADEILHWLTLPIEEYQSTLHRQVQVGKYLNKWMEAPRLPPLQGFVGENDLDTEMLAMAWSLRRKKEEASIPPCRWTAEELTVRRIADSSILRLYQSKLEKMQQSSALSAYVAKADEWRERLWAERRELMEGFVEALKVNTAGGVKKKVALPAVNLFHNSV